MFRPRNSQCKDIQGKCYLPIFGIYDGEKIKKYGEALTDHHSVCYEFRFVSICRCAGLTLNTHEQVFREGKPWIDGVSNNECFEFQHCPIYFDALLGIFYFGRSKGLRLTSMLEEGVRANLGEQEKLLRLEQLRKRLEDVTNDKRCKIKKTTFGEYDEGLILRIGNHWIKKVIASILM